MHPALESINLSAMPTKSKPSFSKSALKARQIGFSTLLGVVCCDQLCFNPGQQISLIDQTLEDARQKLKNIVVLVYDSMAAELRAGLPKLVRTLAKFASSIGALKTPRGFGDVCGHA